MRRVGRIWLALPLVVALASIAGAGEPRPAPLARYFPASDLVAYLEFDGIDAHADAWKKTAARKILNETPTGAMLESVARQLFLVKWNFGEFESPSFEDLSGIARHLVRSGFAFGINRKVGDPSAKPSCVGLVLRGGAKGPLVPMIDKLLASIGLDDKAIAKLDGAGGRKIRLFGAMGGPGIAWWAEGDDLAFGFMDVKSSEAMIAALDGKQPNAVEHPLRKELASSEDGIEAVGLAFLDARALPEIPAEAKMFGLDGIEWVDVRWGYRGEALESVSRVVAPSPRKGVLALFDQPTFDPKSLPPLPGGVGSFTVSSVDLVRAYDQLAALAKGANPALGPAIDGLAEMFRAGTGRRLREDVLSGVGPRLLLADVPTRVLVPTSPFDAMARGMARVARLSLLVEIKDRPRLVEDLEALAKWANARYPIAKAGDKPTPLVRRLKNVDLGYEVALSPTYYPLPAGYRPSIVVGERYLSLGTTPDVARQALRADGEPDASLARALAGLPAKMTLLSVTDTRNSALPEVLANVPSLVQWWAFAIQSAVGASPIQDARAADTISVPAAPGRTEAVPSKLEIKPDGTLVAAGEPLPRPLPLPELPPRLETRPDGTLRLVPQTRPQPPTAPGAAAIAPAPAPAVQEPDPRLTVSVKFPPFRLLLRLDPDEIPTPEEIRPLLFPATYSLSSDAHGFRFASREAFPAWNPTGLAPLAIAASLPIFQGWQVSTEGERISANLVQVGKALGERISANLVQVGKALNEYRENEEHYPPPAVLDEQGEPLLSWRVGLLPYLGQKALHDEFHLDEPWDSPHNKTLISRMPTVFGHPAAKSEPGSTFFRGVIGKGAFFDPEVKEGVDLVMITDGPANTLVLVEAKEAVPWTKPGTEIPFEDHPMLPLLGGHETGGFRALFVDVTSSFVRDSISPISLRAISTRAGAEAISRQEDEKGLLIQSPSPGPSTGER